MMPWVCAASSASAISIPSDSRVSISSGRPAIRCARGNPVQKLHGDEGFAVLLADVVDRADIGMIQRGCGLGFELKAGQRVRIVGNLLRQELEGDEAMQAVSSALYTTPIPPPPSFSIMR